MYKEVDKLLKKFNVDGDKVIETITIRTVLNMIINSLGKTKIKNTVKIDSKDDLLDFVNSIWGGIAGEDIIDDRVKIAIEWYVDDKEYAEFMPIEPYEIVEQILDNTGSNGMGVLRSITRRDVLRLIIEHCAYNQLALKLLDKEELDQVLCIALDYIVPDVINMVDAINRHLNERDRNR